MLRLSDLHASYGAAPVLQGISLAVDRGETVALLGPNGAGKSTLLAAITGTIPRREGRVDLDGVDLSKQQSHAIVASGVALVPEGRLVFAPFRVEDNLRLGAVRLQGELAERFDYVYALFPRLAERRRQPAGTLSGGEQQMLAIGRALMSRPRLLLLDEPSLGLAPLIVRQIFEAIGRIAREEGVTIFLVEQNAFHALRLADRGYVLANGRVRLSGSGRELLANAEVRAAYLEGGHA
jgi:branched-chain amino acid transport system ATP-binding protein